MHEEIKVHRIETQRIALNEPLNQIRKKNEKFIKTIDTFNNEAGAITLDDERNEMKLKEIAVNDEIVLQSNRSFLSFFSCQNLNNKRNIGIVGVVFALGGIICMIAGYNHDNSYYKMAGLCLITMAIGMAILYCLTKNKKNSSPVAISEEQNVQNAEVDDRQNQSNIVLQ